MIASLPMYRRPELTGAHARYWAVIRGGLIEAGIEAPAQLSQEADEHATWTDESLVLSQTCGMPYRNELHGRVTLVGTPDFGLDGCGPGYYRSAIVVRADDGRTEIERFADAVFAYNAAQSQSGLAAAYHHVTGHGFWFERTLRTGQHVESARAVADGRADVAAIDAVTWRLLERHESFAKGLMVMQWTVPNPGLPYISRAGADGGAIFDAVAAAIESLSTEDRQALGLRGLVKIPASAYLEVENPPPEITAAL